MKLALARALGSETRTCAPFWSFASLQTRRLNRVARIGDDGLCASEAGFLFKTSCLRTVFACTTHITTFLLDIGCKFEKRQMRCCVI
jgi:hypothetical protein